MYRVVYTRANGETNRVPVLSELDAQRYYQGALYFGAQEARVHGPCGCTLLHVCLVCRTNKESK